MRGTHVEGKRLALPVIATLAAIAIGFVVVGASQAGSNSKAKGPVVKGAVAFDVSKPLRELAKNANATGKGLPRSGGSDPVEGDTAFGERSLGTAPRLTAHAVTARTTASAIAAPIANFEGLSNQDNFNIFGFRVNPPDPNGEVGPNHYVEMINLVFAVYSKTGTKLLGPVDTGTLWSGFAVPDCTDPSGDPIVVYDQVADRWLLSQFTTAGPEFFNCVAISQTPDPTGAYFRYAFSSGLNFPDYPKYGIWKDSYVITTREFGPTIEYGIGVYAIDRNKMILGDPTAQVVSFFLDGNDLDILPLVGDGLLPADVDGKTKPKQDAKIPLVGTQDGGFAAYGATFDALNVWDLDVHWNSAAAASLVLAAQLPVASFDSVFPCAPTSRDCLPQPGIVNPAQYLDILSYRQRPTWRLAYRNAGTYETMVTNQSVEAAPGVAGVRWYEIRRVNGTYSVYQQGTFAPGDGVHRWMGSAAMDKKGNIALGYSVVNGTTVFPGIRYTGRLAGDPLGTMGSVGEGTIINGSGVQTTTNSRWGDYTSLTVDPVDDCTFWYVNEYYAVSGVPLPAPPGGDTRPWQTRIASFKLPGC